LVDLVLILYSDHLSDESSISSRYDIVPNIAGEIGEFPGISFILYSSIEIECIIIFPEIGVLIDMDEFESIFYDTFSDRIDPEEESMVMVIKDNNWWGGGSVVSARGSFYPHIILDSCTGPELAVFHFLEDDVITENHIIDLPIY
jgi:hypothetical protein